MVLQLAHDNALVGRAVGLLGGLSEATLAQQLHGAVKVAFRLFESVTGLQDAGPGRLAQFLNHGGRNLGHLSLTPSVM